jgi:hypothetical protein
MEDIIGLNMQERGQQASKQPPQFPFR